MPQISRITRLLPLVFLLSLFISAASAQSSQTEPETPSALPPVTDSATATATLPAPEPTPTNNHDPECIVTGCSWELCVPVKANKLYSDCMWRDGFACYRSNVIGWDKEMGIIYDTTVDNGNETEAEKPLAYCAYNSSAESCGWIETPELQGCVANYKAPGGPPPTTIPDYSEDNYTCFVQGCYGEVCMAKWPGVPVPMYDCPEPTPERLKEFEWAQCFESKDCQKYKVDDGLNGTEGTATATAGWGSVTAVTVTAQTATAGPGTASMAPEPGTSTAEPSILTSTATEASSPPFQGSGGGSSSSSPSKRAIIYRGCQWNLDARPELRACLEKYNYPYFADAPLGTWAATATVELGAATATTLSATVSARLGGARGLERSVVGGVLAGLVALVLG